MHLLIISGFLGAGKKTLIIRLAKEALIRLDKIAPMVCKCLLKTHTIHLEFGATGIGRSRG
jgi:signal recognition particle receptor subunit beta